MEKDKNGFNSFAKNIAEKTGKLFGFSSEQQAKVAENIQNITNQIEENTKKNNLTNIAKNQLEQETERKLENVVQKQKEIERKEQKKLKEYKEQLNNISQLEKQFQLEDTNSEKELKAIREQKKQLNNRIKEIQNSINIREERKVKALSLNKGKTGSSFQTGLSTSQMLREKKYNNKQALSAVKNLKNYESIVLPAKKDFSQGKHDYISEIKELDELVKYSFSVTQIIGHILNSNYDPNSEAVKEGQKRGSAFHKLVELFEDGLLTKKHLDNPNLALALSKSGGEKYEEFEYFKKSPQKAKLAIQKLQEFITLKEKLNLGDVKTSEFSMSWYTKINNDLVKISGTLDALYEQGLLDYKTSTGLPNQAVGLQTNVYKLMLSLVNLQKLQKQTRLTSQDIEKSTSNLLVGHFPLISDASKRLNPSVLKLKSLPQEQVYESVLNAVEEMIEGEKGDSSFLPSEMINWKVEYGTPVGGDDAYKGLLVNGQFLQKYFNQDSLAERLKQAIPTFSPQEQIKVVNKIFDDKFGASWKNKDNKDRLEQFRRELGGSYENWAKEKIKNGFIEYIDTDLKTEEGDPVKGISLGGFWPKTLAEMAAKDEEVAHLVLDKISDYLESGDKNEELLGKNFAEKILNFEDFYLKITGLDGVAAEHRTQSPPRLREFVSSPTFRFLVENGRFPDYTEIAKEEQQVSPYSQTNLQNDIHLLSEEEELRKMQQIYGDQKNPGLMGKIAGYRLAHYINAAVEIPHSLGLDELYQNLPEESEERQTFKTKEDFYKWSLSQYPEMYDAYTKSLELRKGLEELAEDKDYGLINSGRLDIQGVLSYLITKIFSDDSEFGKNLMRQLNLSELGDNLYGEDKNSVQQILQREFRLDDLSFAESISEKRKKEGEFKANPDYWLLKFKQAGYFASDIEKQKEINKRQEKAHQEGKELSTEEISGEIEQEAREAQIQSISSKSGQVLENLGVNIEALETQIKEQFGIIFQNFKLFAAILSSEKLDPKQILKAYKDLQKEGFLTSFDERVFVEKQYDDFGKEIGVPDIGTYDKKIEEVENLDSLKKGLEEKTGVQFSEEQFSIINSFLSSYEQYISKKANFALFNKYKDELIKRQKFSEKMKDEVGISALNRLIQLQGKEQGKKKEIDDLALIPFSQDDNNLSSESSKDFSSKAKEEKKEEKRQEDSVLEQQPLDIEGEKPSSSKKERERKRTSLSKASENRERKQKETSSEEGLPPASKQETKKEKERKSFDNKEILQELKKISKSTQAIEQKVDGTGLKKEKETLNKNKEREKEKIFDELLEQNEEGTTKKPKKKRNIISQDSGFSGGGDDLGGGSGKKSRDPYAQTAKEYESHMIEAIRLQKEYEINKKRIASEPLSKRGKELLKLENIELVEQIALHKQIAQELEKEASQSENFGRTQQKLTREIQKSEHSVVTYGQGASNIFEKMGIDVKRAFMRIFDGSLIYKFFGLVQRGFTQTIQLAKQLDKSMVNLRIVTGGTKSETRELVNVYAQLARQLGVTTQEVVNGATEWLRQGYTVQESQKLVTASVYLSKLGMIESGQATEYLTSVLKGFKLETSEAVSVVDKLTKVDLEAATSAGNIAEALSRTSVSAQNAGVDLDKLIGYVTEVLQVTQKSASSVGESFKTIFARYQNVKASAFKSMDLSEEAAETTEGINDIERVLSKVGIKIRTSSKEFASFDSILAQLAENWIKYSSVEKAAISTAIAGTRQRENFLVLMENYNEAMDIAATSTASAGTAEEKYAAYTEGMEASVSGLTAAWEKLIAKLKASEGLKWLVDSAKKLLDLLPHITGLLSQLAGTGFSKFAVPRVIGSLMGTGQLLKEKFSATEEQKMARAKELLAADGIQDVPERYKDLSRQTRRRVSQSFTKDRLNKSIEDEQEKIDLTRQKTKEKAGSFETRFKDTIKTGISDPLEKIAKTAENIQLALEEQQSQEENSSSTDKKPNEQGSVAGSETAASSLKTLRFKKDGSLDLRTLKWAGVSKDTDTYKDVTSLFKAYEENPDKEGAFQTLQNSLKELGFEVDNTSLKIRANGEATASNTSSTQKDTQETKDHTEKVEENTGATSANTDAKKKDTSQTQGAAKPGKGLAIASKIASGVLSGVAAGIGAGLTTVAKDAEGNTYDASTAAKATVGTLQGVSAATAAIPMIGPAISGVLGTVFSAFGPSIAAAIDKDKIEKEKQLKLAQEQLDALNDIKSGTQSIKQEVIGNEKLSSRDQLTSLYTTVNELQKQAGNNGQLAQALVEETSKLGISDWAGTYYNIYDLTVEEREKFLDAIERAINIANMAAQDKSSEAENYEKARKALGLKEGETVDSVKSQADFYAENGYIEALKDFQANVAKVEAYERERIKLIMDNLYSTSKVAYETEDRLQELGLEGIQTEVFLNQLELDPETAKILQGLGAIDENNNLTDLGEQIFNQLIKSDQRMYSVINPSSKTLSEIETILKKGDNNTAQQQKEEILKLLGLSEEEYDKLSSSTKENIQYLSAAELSGGPSGIQESLAKYNEYLSSLSKNGSLTAEQIAGLPTFLSEVATEPDELLKRIKEKISSLETGYALTSVDAFFETEGNTKKVLQAQGLYDNSYADKSLRELLESVEISDEVKEKLQGVKNKYLELFTNAAKDLIDTQYLENLREGQIAFLNKDIENLNEQKEALQNINKQREYELKLIKAKQQLEDARKEKKRVWREGIGWTYESDQEGIAEAQKNLEEVQAEKQTEDLQQQIDLLTAQKELLEELPDKNQLTEYTEAYLTWFGDVEKSQASVIKAISDGYDSLVNKSKDVSFGDNTTTGTKGAVGEISAGQAETSKAQGQATQKTYRENIQKWINEGKISAGDLPENYDINKEDSSISDDQYTQLSNEVKGKKSLEDKFKPYIDLVKQAAGISKATGQYIPHGSFYNKKTKWTMKTFLFDGDNYDLIKNGAAEFRSLSEDKKKQIVAMPNGWYLALASLGNIDKAADRAFLADGLYDLFGLQRRNVDHGKWKGKDGLKYTLPSDLINLKEDGVQRYYGAYASGTFAAEGPALVNELGTEGIITPQGTITAFNGPHGVVPASLTKNLAELGLEAPRLIKELSSVYGLNKDYSGHISNVHDESINARQILVQINADKDFNIDRFVEELKSSVVLNKQNHKI